MKVRADLVPVVVEDLKKREAESDSEYLHGADRVDISHVEQLRFRVRKGRDEFIVDEPPDRGGTDQGVNPLGYFLAGAASYLATQFLRVIIAKSMRVETFSMSALGRFDRRLGGSFTEIRYAVNMTGSEDEDSIRRLSERAQLQCYAHNTLKKAGLTLVTDVEWNGRKLPQ